MELFKNIRLKIGDAILKNKIAKTKRKKHYSNINQVKNIGIVWDASKIDDFACLSRFYQKMHERNIDVKILGYFPGKNLPNQYTAIRFLTCIRKEELNLFIILYLLKPILLSAIVLMSLLISISKNCYHFNIFHPYQMPDLK